MCFPLQLSCPATASLKLIYVCVFGTILRAFSARPSGVQATQGGVGSCIFGARLQVFRGVLTTEGPQRALVFGGCKGFRVQGFKGLRFQVLRV